MEAQQTITIVGAGLVGSLLATMLGQQGFNVEVFERRPDMRRENMEAGRSINLAVSTRALCALDLIGMKEEIMSRAVPMRGRMIHLLNQEMVFQPYSENKVEYLHSISRGELNKVLMDAAERTENVCFHFNQRVQGVDFAKGILHLHDEEENADYEMKADLIIGSDGTHSVIRQAMEALPDHHSLEEFHSYGYKELTIPPAPDGSFLMEKNALHLWPRGTHMLLATANNDGSFTCTLFLPFEGENSFEELTTAHAVEAFLTQQFPDVIPFIQDAVNTFLTNPIGNMSTVKAYPWNVNDKVLLIGDAAHAIVPFFGQGMNAGFEDCTVFYNCLKEHKIPSGEVDWSRVLEDFVHLRKENTDAIADMAIENFDEIHKKVANPQFLLEKKVEGVLEREFVREYFSRYALVCFTRVPYRMVMNVGLINQEILSELCRHITSETEVDMDYAKKLVHTKLTPVLKEYRRELLLD